MKDVSEKSYYKRYCAQCRRFEVSGACMIGGGILLDVLSNSAFFTISVIVAGLGALLLILGGSSSRPHNVIKAFAQQYLRYPSEDFIRGLLEALEVHSGIQLVKSSIILVENAVAYYAQSKDADPALVSKLKTVVETRVRRKIF